MRKSDLTKKCEFLSYALMPVVVLLLHYFHEDPKKISEENFIGQAVYADYIKSRTMTFIFYLDETHEELHFSGGTGIRKLHDFSPVKGQVVCLEYAKVTYIEYKDPVHELKNIEFRECSNGYN